MPGTKGRHRLWRWPGSGLMAAHARSSAGVSRPGTRAGSNSAPRSTAGKYFGECSAGVMGDTHAPDE